MKKLFARKEILKVKSKPIDPSMMGKPVTAAEFQHRGMAYYARNQLNAAETDLNEAIRMDSNNIDSFYCLGIVYKAMDVKNKAVDAFTQVISLIRAQVGTEKTRNDMLRRLALGHINEITQGDWNLEKEIWKRIT